MMSSAAASATTLNHESGPTPAERVLLRARGASLELMLPEGMPSHCELLNSREPVQLSRASGGPVSISTQSARHLLDIESDCVQGRLQNGCGLQLLVMVGQMVTERRSAVVRVT